LFMDTKSSLTLGRRMFARATELDPDYARAYADIVRCDARLYLLHAVPISVDDILVTAGKALAIDPNLAEAHAARGVALMVADRHSEAAPVFAQALALDPNSFDAHHSYAQFCMIGGSFELAAKHLLRAMEIRLDDYQSPFWLQQVFRSLGRLEEAKKYARLGLKRAEEALRLHPESSKPAQMGACGWAILGERDRAKEWLARALAIDPDDNLARYNAACTYSLLGEFDRAFDQLEICLRQVGGSFKLWFKNDSDLDPIRNHPRYQKLIELTE
jgi:adenylate cyclase